jgi:serine/threonine-protein kinase
MSEKPYLDQLAARIADGEAVDWDEAERSASTPAERRAVRNLRLVESISEVHGSQRSLAGEAPSESSLAGETQNQADLEATVLPAPRKVWGPLEIREKIGEGAFGEVYRAWDRNLDREVALKLLKKDTSAKGSLGSTVLREGRLLARVDHPNVVTVHGVETHEERVGLWMEFVRGRSLEALLREQGKLGAREAALIGIDLCRALAAVHGAGLVHRDIKAQNVLRREGGRILLMDFGAGLDVRSVEGRADRGISGTPLYIAPEVLRGEGATARSDVYSLGVLLYRLVTASYPIDATSFQDLRDKHARHEAKLLRDVRSDLPEAFVKAVERALAWDAGERFSTAGQMEQALSAALGMDAAPAAPVAAEPRAAGRRWPWVAAAAAVVVLILAVAALGQLGLLRWPATAERAEAAREPSQPSQPATEPPATTIVQTDLPAQGEVVDAGPAESPEATPRPGTPAPGRAAPAPPVSKAYTVEASLIRVSEQGRRERLQPGGQLALGDQLSLEFEASKDVYVYVINEDEQGHAYSLFPLPGLDLENPLPGGRRHVIPGRRGDQELSWVVDSPGGREHLLVLASPERLIEFEAEMSLLARPRAGQIAQPIPEDVQVKLRGIGSLAESTAPARAGSAGRLFHLAQQLAGESEVVEGAWLRHIELANPAP